MSERGPEGAGHERAQAGRAAGHERAQAGGAGYERAHAGSGPDVKVLHVVAHGTRSALGQHQVRALVDAVASLRPDLDVRLSYVDVQQPRISDAITPGSVIVPLLLSTGYHVRVDIARSAAGNAVVAPPLGPDPALTASLRRRLPQCDAVVLAAAGSSDPGWRSDVDAVAADLGAYVAYASGSAPRLPDVVAQLRRDGARRIGIAAYLLAEGLFYRSLQRAGADSVTAPLCQDPAVTELVLSRYDMVASARQPIRS
jgi:sirohydrochlorin ferrochelatase